MSKSISYSDLSLNPFFLISFQYDETVAIACRNLIDHPCASPLDDEDGFSDIISDSFHNYDKIIRGAVVCNEGEKFISVMGIVTRDNYGQEYELIAIIWDNKKVFSCKVFSDGESEIYDSVDDNKWREDFVRLYSLFYKPPFGR